MTARIKSVDGNRVTLELTIELGETMLSSEEVIQSGLNDSGQELTAVALKAFDTDGSPIEYDSQLWRTKGLQPKKYQTSYGEVSVDRHVYQRSGGGKTFCPLEQHERIILTATPHFCR